MIFLSLLTDVSDGVGWDRMCSPVTDNPRVSQSDEWSVVCVELPAACCPDTNTGTGLRKLESEISSRLPEATPSAVPAGVVWKYLSQFQSHSFSLLFNAVVSHNFSSSCLFSGSLMLLTILGFYRINNSIQSIDLSIFVLYLFDKTVFSYLITTFSFTHYFWSSIHNVNE